MNLVGNHYLGTEIGAGSGVRIGATSAASSAQSGLGAAATSRRGNFRRRPAVTRLLTSLIAVACLAAVLWLPLPGAFSSRVAHSVEIVRTPAQVYEFVSTPAYWPIWHPSSVAVSGAVDHSLLVGEEVAEQFRVAGRTGTALWQVTAREPTWLWTIAGTIRGRPAGQVTYRVMPTKRSAADSSTPNRIAETTHFEREFVYYPPNLLFAILDKLTINGLIEDESQRAVAKLKQVLETQTSQH